MSGKFIERTAMKDNIELLNHLIDKEIESIESMLHLNKEDELTINRLQDKLRVVERNIEEHKQLIKEYRSHLRDMSESNHTRTKLNPLKKEPSGYEFIDFTDQISKKTRKVGIICDEVIVALFFYK